MGKKRALSRERVILYSSVVYNTGFYDNLFRVWEHTGANCERCSTGG